MSILDDAIREHLELKRAHGADDAEIKKLEDEAFGPPARPDEPDPFAEAPTEFLTAPDAEEAQAEESSGRRVPNIADLQEAPELPADDGAQDLELPAEAEGAVGEEPDAALQQEVDEVGQGDEPLHTTEEREAIASQPTEFFDVQAEMETGGEAESPSDEDLAAAELSEPRLAPVDPASGIEAAGPGALEDDEDDDFFSEQRLSDELDRALEAPVTDEHAIAPLEDAGEHRIAPVEEDEDEGPTALQPPTEEGTAIYEVESEDDADSGEADSGEHGAFEPESGHEDVLEDTPEFLEESPEDDDLWFEQKPPKDFDFDD